MATVHTINSSLLFLTLVLEELPNLLTIEQISPTDESSEVVWNKSSGSLEPELNNYKWTSFTLTFSEEFDVSNLMEKYPSSIMKIDTRILEKKEKEEQVEAKAQEQAEAKAQKEAQKEAQEVKKAKNKTKKQPRVYKIKLAKYSRNSPNAINPSNIYSGIGPVKKHGHEFRTNFIDPGPPPQTYRAVAANEASAIKAAENSINARKKRITNAIMVTL